MVGAALRLSLSILIAGSCFAQQASQGVENPWDLRTILDNLIKDTNDLKPVLNSLNPQQWYEKKGAPSTYILQLQTAQQQLNDLTVTMAQLSQKTESLPLALDNYFRLEALEVTTRSLESGASHYADRQTDGKLAQLIARNFTNRQRFRDYIKDLAANQEQTCKIADAEAQRCRGMISKEPAAQKKKLHK